MRVLFVHGACVVDGTWWWHRMTGPLAQLGVHSAAVELPSCGVASAPTAGLGDLYDDIAAVRAAALGDEPTVLVGHSYGGMVITGASAELPGVHHLVYLSSMLPESDETLASMAGPDSPNWLHPADEHTVRLRADLTEQEIREHFFADCDPDAVSGALARLGRQSAAVFGQPPAHAAWRQTPSTSVICTEDRATPPTRQRRWAARAGTVVELAADHHPFLSRPGQLADILANVLAR
jgi:pimeloyl-ACP methyl ester carboxylesterase